MISLGNTFTKANVDFEGDGIYKSKITTTGNYLLLGKCSSESLELNENILGRFSTPEELKHILKSYGEYDNFIAINLDDNTTTEYCGKVDLSNIEDFANLLYLCIIGG